MARHRRAMLWTLLGLAALGIVARVLLIVASNGSNDARIWNALAVSIDERGLFTAYQQIRWLNHPPLMALWSVAALKIAALSDWRFVPVFKLPMLLADIAGTVLIWRVCRDRGAVRAAAAAALFAWNPVSILITGFHGNTDSLCAVLCLLAAYLLHEKKPLAAGIALGAAINVKIVPLMLLPGLLLLLKERRELLRFSTGLGLALLPFLPAALSVPSAFYRNLFGYSTTQQAWGFLAVAIGAKETLPGLHDGIIAVAELAGRGLVLAFLLLLGAANRWRGSWNAFELATLSFAVFFVFAPGFAVQYTVWIIPVFFAANLGRATSFSLLAGLFVFLVYYTFRVDRWPLASNHTGTFRSPSWQFGLLAWTYLAQYLFSSIAGCLRRSRVSQ